MLNHLFCLAPIVDEHGHLKIYLPKKLLECLPKCTSLPKERHRWNTNEVRPPLLIVPLSSQSISALRCPSKRHVSSPGPISGRFVSQVNCLQSYLAPLHKVLQSTNNITPSSLRVETCHKITVNLLPCDILNVFKYIMFSRISGSDYSYCTICHACLTV